MRWALLALAAVLVLRRRAPSVMTLDGPPVIAGMAPGSTASTGAGSTSVYRPVATYDRSDVRTTGLAPGSRARPGMIYRPPKGSAPSTGSASYRIGPSGPSRKV